jgi:hypothetical protein
MSIVMEMQSPDIVQASDYNLSAGVRYGSDGDPTYPIGEYDVGSSADDTIVGMRTWDGDPTDGVDSGWVDLDFTLDAVNDTITYSVGGGDVLTYSFAGKGIDSVDEIAIRAAVTNQAAMLWQNLDVSFYHDGILADSYQGDGPQADLRADPQSGSQDDMLYIQPEASNINQIHVTAQVRLAAPAGVYLGENDIFGGLLIHGV